MKTKIIITGSGIASKNTLANACQTLDSEVKNLNFNNYAIYFNTKKQAIKALSEAYKYLRSDKEDWNASSASYCRGVSLSYDAGRAEIIECE